jgi:hypothetical protein
VVATPQNYKAIGNMKSSALRSALTAEDLPTTMSMPEYKVHVLRSVLVEPVEVEIRAMRLGFNTALGESGAAVLRRYLITCEDIMSMVSDVCVRNSEGERGRATYSASRLLLLLSSSSSSLL